MSKYDVRFCDCGRVHFLDSKQLIEVCDTQDKMVLHVCNNCGKTTLIWLEDYMDGKCWCSRDVKDEDINASKVGWIVTSVGSIIWMETGNEATALNSNGFIDWDTKTPSGITEEEFMIKRKTVNMQHTINYIRNEEKLDAMSCFYIKNLDWSGSKYNKF